ncbi:SMI1/KNR4 family protein [Paenibacillus jilunlii]|uniref:SMI1/KNR4 family protein n=1 Tax=Paenibacillus jilunlii TaxID=682956 RepID=A0A1G9XA36_9BACL|nr:SMI1/KNR4 family protein [Paenibacillus jilunlii]KWX73628.1 hypothetical protein AML91_18375 [Paenibacillus jilunlii]SDM93620.1 hypothetical protein SAMN05216191_12176 [Paenibacillus jilunlii]
MHKSSATESLTRLFQEYLELSARLRPGYTASLGSGQGEAQLAISGIVPDVPELLQAIYSQVSGTGSDEEDPSLIEFIPGYRLIHIQEYAQEIKVLESILKEKGYSGGGTVLPVLTNYGSDFICYYQSEDGTEQICDLLHDYGDLVVMYDSPEKFLETLCEFYKQEVYFLDEEGYLDCDLVLEGEVGAALNPSANYWSE